MLSSPQLVAVTAEFLVDSINGLVAGGHVNREFVGVILLPIVGNAAGAYAACRSPHGERGEALQSLSVRTDAAVSRRR